MERFIEATHRMQWMILLISCVSMISASSESDKELTTKSAVSQNQSSSESVARIRLRFIAANALELQWVDDYDKRQEFPSMHGTWESEIEMDSSNDSHILAVCSDDGNCSRPVLQNECHLRRSEVCRIWNLKPTHVYTMCLRSWSSGSPDSGSAWKTIQVNTEFRQPPTIVSCHAQILYGDSKDVVDPSKVLEVQFMRRDDITISCRITGHPTPRIIWCKNRLDCNVSNVNGNEVTINSDGSLHIPNALRDHEGLFHCIAENQYGRSITSAIRLQFMEIAQFPSSDDQKIKSTVNAGDRAKLECRYPKDSLRLAFSWSKVKSLQDPSPQPVIPSDRVMLGWDGALLFLYTLAEDSGIYMCNVANQKLDSAKVSGSPAELEVTDGVLFNRAPLLLTKSPDTVSVIVGDSLVLQCVFAGKPIPEVVWQWDSQKESGRYDLSDRNVTLTIHNIQLLDEQKFTCSATNSGGNSAVYTIQVVVHEAPRFLRRPTSVNLTVGQTVKLYCDAGGSPRPLLQWLINGSPIQAGESEYLWNYTLSENLNVLTISGLTQLTAFNVQCNISNKFGYQLANAFVNVYLPTKITRSPEDVILSGQSMVVFSCEVETDPSTLITVTWLRGYKEIVYDNQRIYQLPNHSLVLNLTNEEDGGNSFVAQYTCIASNGMNDDSRSARLRPPVVNAFKDASASVLPDMMWLGVICGFICLVIISMMAVCMLYNSPKRAKANATNTAQPRSENAWRPENFRMAHRSKSKPRGRMAQTDVCFEFHSTENTQVHTALQQMYIPRERLQLGNCIGRGQFGRVFSAYLCHAREKLKEHVAVKTMKYKPEETEMAELFLREALLMKDFWHPHVLGVIGVTFDPDGSPMVILPFMANGDLRKYIMSTELEITVMQLLKMSLQVAYGMTYLSSMRFVHRDLAARNCMVDERGIVKVADFGLSRELILCDYYRLSNNKTPVPVRWMAPECLEANVFTTMSDVWSFGVLLWELVTRGAVPFSDLENWEVAGYIQSGKRLPQPLYCPDSVYFIMKSCWQEESDNRPTFEQIAHDIEEIIRSAQALSSSGSSPTVTTLAPIYSNATNTRSPVPDSDYHD